MLLKNYYGFSNQEFREVCTKFCCYLHGSGSDPDTFEVKLSWLLDSMGGNFLWASHHAFMHVWNLGIFPLAVRASK